MKPCSYCGRDNDDTATRCGGCGTPFSPSSPAAPGLTNAAQALVVLATFATVEQASLLAGRLEAAGIDACIPEEYASGVFSAVLPLSSVTVRVAAKDLEAARAVAAEPPSGTDLMPGTDPSQPEAQPSGPERAELDTQRSVKSLGLTLGTGLVVLIAILLVRQHYAQLRPRALVSAGIAHAKKGEWDQAIADFNRAVTADPEDPIPHKDLVYAYEEKGALRQAIAELDELVRLNPQAPQAYISRGTDYERLGDYTNALGDFDTVLRLNPQEPEAYVGRAYALLKTRDFDRAISNLDEALELDPKNFDALANRGYAFRAKGEFAEAIRDLTAAIRLEPTNIWAYGTRGAAYESESNYGKALADFDTILRLNPKQARGYYFRGRAWTGQGQYARALSDFETAVRLSPNNATNYNALAWLLATCPANYLRDGTRAISLARKACDLSGWKQWPCVGTLGAAYAEAGNFEAALKYQRQVLTMSGLTANARSEAQHRIELYERHQPFHQEPPLSKPNP